MSRAKKRAANAKARRQESNRARNTRRRAADALKRLSRPGLRWAPSEEIRLLGPGLAAPWRRHYVKP